jgi:L,D-peptidoglycan transpeptidase YkuD (ErfK/YbiS/YcfS/YnhG family)
MVTIVSAGWSATTGIMSLDQRAPGGPWTWTGYYALVDFGPSGMGWGVGLHQGGQGPQKREGDGRSPAGVFHLGHTFGYAPFPTRMPYWQVGPQHWCVDDSASPHYNQIIDTNYTPVDWRHAEPMFRPDGQYQLGLVVDHNPGNAPGYGSCIFLHVWRGLGAPTAGCTSMALQNVGDLLQWLDPARDPILLQMPIDQYRGIEGDWGLPIR